MFLHIFNISLPCLSIDFLQPSRQFHEPRHPEMDSHAAPNVTAVQRNDTENIAAENRTDGFAQRLAKVKESVKSNHWQHGFLAQDARHANDKETAKKPLNHHKIPAIGQFKNHRQQPPGQMRLFHRKTAFVRWIALQEIRLERRIRDERDHQQP